MHIIGFGGKSGSGKTTAAGMLATLLARRGYSVKLDTFADPIRKIAIAKFSRLKPGSRRQRLWLQRKATKTRERDPDYFCKQLFLRNDMDALLWENYKGCLPADFLIIHDLRMRNEFDFCRRFGVVVFLIGTHVPLPEPLAAHGTETAIDGLLHGADYMIPKQPSLARLAVALEAMVEAGHHLKKVPAYPGAVDWEGE